MFKFGDLHCIGKYKLGKKKKKNPSQGLIEKKKLAAMFGIDLNGTGLRFPATGRTNSEMPFLRV